VVEVDTFYELPKKFEYDCPFDLGPDPVLVCPV
jgi:hypothetical protein